MKKTVDVAVPIGPVHPCWKEPIRIQVRDERRTGTLRRVELGEMKKGIKRMKRGTPRQSAYGSTD